MSRKNNDDIEPDLEDKVIETEADAPERETRTGEVKSGDETVLSRRVLVFRTLRVGGALTVPAAVALTLAWAGSRQERTDPHDSTSMQVVCAIPSSAWFFIAGNGKWRIVPAVIVGLGWTAIIVYQLRPWWMLFDKTSAGTALLLAWALGTFGLGIVAVFDLLLHGIRDRQRLPEGSRGDPAGIVFSHHDGSKAGSGIARRARWVAVTLILVLTLTGVTVSSRALTDLPIYSTLFSHITVAMPEGALPEFPATVGFTVAWTRDIPDLLAVAVDAAGPVILTIGGLTALRPDGTTLWTYHRQAKYEDPLTSPGSRHVVLRMSVPRGEPGQGDGHDQTDTPTYDNLALVLDSLIGQVTSGHPTGGSGIQLTDSVVLGGGIAYDLADGGQHWTLPDDFEVAKSHTKSTGHASLILERRRESSDRSNPVLLVAPDTNPSATVEIQSIPAEDTCGPFEGIVAANGWIAQYAEASPERREADDERLTESATIQAVTLDSLAGLETNALVPLDRAAGVNYRTSTVSGTLTLYPEYSVDEKKKNYEMISLGKSDKAWVGAVFDPVSRTTTPASQYTGVAVAKIGVTIIREGETFSGAVVVQPGGGSDGATIPITPGSTYLSFASYAQYGRGSGSYYLHIPVQLTGRYGGVDAVFENTPGVTVVVFDPEKEIEEVSSYRSNYHFYHRLYDLTGGVS